MKENADKYLDDLAKKVIKEAQNESPSLDFTDVVMSQVNALSKSNVTVYKPLISKTAWVLISIIFLVIFSYVLLSGNETNSLGWSSKLDFSSLFNNSLSNTLSSLKLSKILMYAVLLFGLMICIQIPLLKNHFDRRFEA